MIQQFHSWIYVQKKTKTLIQKDISIPMFTAALFTIAKMWKEATKMSINRWKDKEEVVHVHNEY